MLTLEDASRFETSRAVGAYLGLVVGKDQSGERETPRRSVSLSKATGCSKEAFGRQRPARILGPFGEDCELRWYGLKICERGGKDAKKRAVVVAVARKLSVLLLHRLWVSGEVYEPLYNAKKRFESQAA